MNSADFKALIVGTANLEQELGPKLEDLARRKAAIIAEAEKQKTVETTATGGRVFRWEGEGGTTGLSLAISWPAATAKYVKDQKAAIEKICGDEATFKKLFYTIPLTLATKNLRDVAVAVLGKAKAKRLLALCEVPNAPKLKFTRKDEE